MTRRFGGRGLQVVFWILIGLAASSFLKYGIGAIIALALLMAAVLCFVKGGRETLRTALFALADGARHALPVGVACALVGVIIGILTLTGAATTFAGYIIQMGQSSLLLSLVLTMLVCLILGMGIPTIPNYIITSSLAAPALLTARRAADRLAHVRLLLRDHGRPDAAGRAGGIRRRADRPRVRHEDRPAGDAHRDRRLHHPVHGGLRRRR